MDRDDELCSGSCTLVVFLSCVWKDNQMGRVDPASNNHYCSHLDIYCTQTVAPTDSNLLCILRILRILHTRQFGSYRLHIAGLRTIQSNQKHFELAAVRNHALQIEASVAEDNLLVASVVRYMLHVVVPGKFVEIAHG